MCLLKQAILASFFNKFMVSLKILVTIYGVKSWLIANWEVKK